MARKTARPAAGHAADGPDEQVRRSAASGDGADAARDGATSSEQSAATAFRQVLADLTEDFQRIMADLQVVQDRLLGASS